MTRTQEDRSRKDRDHRPSPAVNLLLILLGIVFAAVAAEVGLRIVLRESDALNETAERSRVSLYTDDDVLLYRYRPGAQTTYTRAEFSTEVRINSLGLRDDEHTYQKPEGVFRILILGDSLMAALQVPMEDSLPALLEERLNTDPRTALSGYRFEVINGAVNGYSTLDEYLFLREEGYRYEPDLVLYAFANNDTEDIISPTRQRNGITQYALADESGNLILDEAGEPILIREPYVPESALPDRSLVADRWLKDRSKLYAVIISPALDRVRPLWRAFTNLFRRVDRPVFYEKHFAVNPEVPGYRESWQALSQLVLMMRDRSESVGACFASFMIPNQGAVYPEIERHYYVGFDLLSEHWDFEKQDRELADLYSTHDIPYLLLLEPMRAAAEASDEPLFFELDHHMTAAGHRAATEAVYEWLVSAHLVPTSEGGEPTRCGQE
ncbi:MAG TPA: hypothetical protein ENI95_14210 [Chloroflexi bacterium]|nr:hypothetical protein [Chloroflexota bacterium]